MELASGNARIDVAFNRASTLTTKAAFVESRVTVDVHRARPGRR
jgi:hypothetical protein